MLRHAFTYLLFCLTLRLGFAQPKSVNSPFTAKIDSLQRLLANPPTLDTLQVIRLHALARLCFVDLQFKRGLLAAKQAQALANQVQYANGEGLYQQTLTAFSYTNSLWFYYDFQFGLAADKQQAPPFTSTINSSQGYPLSLDYTEVNRRLETALTYFTTVRDAEMMALILSFISANYRYLHQVDESLFYLERSIQAFQQANQPVASCYLLAYKARLLQGPNQLPEAKHEERVVNQFLTVHGNSSEAALIAYQLSWYYVTRNQLVRSFEVSSKANASLARLGEEHLRPFILENLGYIYITLKAYKKALNYFKKAVLLLEKTNNQSRLAWMYNKVAFTLIALNRFDEASEYISKAKRNHDTKPGSLQPNVDLAKYYDATGQRMMGLGHYQQALPNFFKALQIDRKPGGNGLDFYFNFYIAQCYQQLGNVPASVAYGLKSYQKATLDNSSDGREITLKSSQLLFENYERLGQPIAAYQYLKTYYIARQVVDDQNAANRLAEIEIETIVQQGEQDKARLEQARLLNEKENQNQRWWLFTIGAALVSAFILLGLLYRNNQHKQQANRLLNRQKQEIERQRAKAEQALTELKATQNQLIQQEKLASLGELTAGIAHEIQNPLNFVNNYSALSTKLVQQLSQKMVMANAEEYVNNQLISTLIKNLQKITHYGERASAIVKSMLAHSRTSTVEYRPTDLNALVEEYTRLTYHGQHAKDRTVKCQLITEFDSSIGLIVLAPQEIGQALLNLLTNAFYAVHQRWAGQFNDAGSASTHHFSSPKIQVSTQLIGQMVEIRVNDNGKGIADEVKDKIFQPFYTTKPVGEGTGLGLSLSYDIIVKGHGGSLTVESDESVGTTFFIRLPTTRSVPNYVRSV